MRNRYKAVSASHLENLPKVKIGGVNTALKNIRLSTMQKISYQDDMNNQFDIKHNMAFLDEVIAHLKLTYEQTSDYYSFIELAENLITTGLKLKIAAQTKYKTIINNPA